MSTNMVIPCGITRLVDIHQVTVRRFAFRTTNGVLTQTLAEDQYRVRAMSAYRIGMGMVVFFSLFVGWMAGITSVRLTLLFMGALGVAISIIFWIFSPAVRNQD